MRSVQRLSNCSKSGYRLQLEFLELVLSAFSLSIFDCKMMYHFAVCSFKIFVIMVKIKINKKNFNFVILSLNPCYFFMYTKLVNASPSIPFLFNILFIFISSVSDKSSEFLILRQPLSQSQSFVHLRNKNRLLTTFYSFVSTIHAFMFLFSVLLLKRDLCYPRIQVSMSYLTN